MVSVVQANRRGKAGLQRKDYCVVVGASVCLSVRLCCSGSGALVPNTELFGVAKSLKGLKRRCCLVVCALVLLIT